MINKQGFQKIEQNKIMRMVMIIVTYSQLWWRWWCWQPVHYPRVLPCPPWQTRWGGVVSQDMNCLADYDYLDHGMKRTSPASSLSSSWCASQASWSAGSEKSSIMKKFIPTWFCYFWSCSWWWWPWPRWQYQYLHKSCYLRKWSSALVGPERSKTHSWFNVL